MPAAQLGASWWDTAARGDAAEPRAELLLLVAQLLAGCLGMGLLHLPASSLLHHAVADCCGVMPSVPHAAVLQAQGCLLLVLLLLAQLAASWMDTAAHEAPVCMRGRFKTGALRELTSKLLFLQGQALLDCGPRTWYLRCMSPSTARHF